MPRFFFFFLASILIGSWADLGLGMDPDGRPQTDGGGTMDPNG